jgi:hypothetical protein
MLLKKYNEVKNERRVCVNVCCYTYRLHEYFGLTPNFAHASLSGVPSGISIFLLPDVSTVICNEEDVVVEGQLLSVFRLIQQQLLLDELGTTNACVVRPSSTSSSVDIDISNLDIIILLSRLFSSSSSCFVRLTRSHLSSESLLSRVASNAQQSSHHTAVVVKLVVLHCLTLLDDGTYDGQKI